MAHRVFAALFLAACMSARPSPTGAVVIDLSSLRSAQTSMAQLESVGLLVVRGQLASLEEETAKLDGNVVVAEAETVTTTEPTLESVEVASEAVPTRTDGMLMPARQSEDLRAMLAAPKLSDANIEVRPDDVPAVSYYPIAIEPGADRFSLELPAGRAQNMFLIGFARPDPTRKPLPTYVSAALNVTLLAQEETEVVFATYPAGVAIPQFLPPTLVGLRDASGTPITDLPDMSCLAVARAEKPRSDFPAVSLSRLNLGSVSAQLQTVGSTSLFVLPIGRYRLDCFAVYAGKVFGIDPLRPLEIEVKQGEVVLPTAGLVKLRELESSTPTLTPTLPTEMVAIDPSTGMPAIGVSHHYAISVSQGLPKRSSLTGETGGDGVNFTSTTPGSLMLAALLPDGSVDRAASDLVRVEMHPAFVPGRWGQELGSALMQWMPFNAAGSAVRVLDVQLIDGYATLPDVLRFDQLDTSASNAEATFHYFLTVRPYDANGALLRREGARYVTVSPPDRPCSAPSPARVGAFLLTQPADTLIVDTVALRALTEHALLVALSALDLSGNGPSRCAAQLASGGVELGFALQGTSTGKLTFSPAFNPLGRTIEGDETYTLQVPGGDSQGMVWDALRASDAVVATRPKPGDMLSNLVIRTFVSATSGQTASDWSLTIAAH